MKSPAQPLPQHIAFIMDGNGRWAQRKGLARLKGHAEGAETVRRLCEDLVNLGIPHATFYAFSTENWKRSQEEISGLFTLMRAYFKSELKHIAEKGIRLRFIGDRTATSRLEADILSIMAEAEQATAHNTKLTVTFAINYGAHDELTRAVRTLATQVQSGTLAPQNITEHTITNALDTSGQPAPDLLIRTSGEQRLSNFLLWQLAYAELYFSEVPWPDFTTEHLHQALTTFTSRQRKFGAV